MGLGSEDYVILRLKGIGPLGHSRPLIWLVGAPSLVNLSDLALGRRPDLTVSLKNPHGMHQVTGLRPK